MAALPVIAFSSMGRLSSPGPRRIASQGICAKTPSTSQVASGPPTAIKMSGRSAFTMRASRTVIARFQMYRLKPMTSGSVAISRRKSASEVSFTFRSQMVMDVSGSCSSTAFFRQKGARGMWIYWLAMAVRVRRMGFLLWIAAM